MDLLRCTHSKVKTERKRKRKKGKKKNVKGSFISSVFLHPLKPLKAYPPCVDGALHLHTSALKSAAGLTEAAERRQGGMGGGVGAQKGAG